MAPISIAPRDLAILCAAVADDKKAEDVLVLDMRRIFSLADYFVIASGLHAKHLQAVSDGLAERLRAVSGAPRRLGREGYESGVWLLIDYNDVVVHVFHKDHRAYYELERLWGDAKTVAWKTRGRILLKKYPVAKAASPPEPAADPVAAMSAGSPADAETESETGDAKPVRPGKRRGIRVRLAPPSAGSSPSR